LSHFRLRFKVLSSLIGYALALAFTFLAYQVANCTFDAFEGGKKVRGGFFNWVFRSSSFSLFVLGLCHSSGSRFSSQSGLMFEWHRCKHMSDRQWRAPLSGALQDAQQTFSASSTNLVQ
jgi:hypothetical protein